VERLIQKCFYQDGIKLNLEHKHYGDFAGSQRTANSRKSVKDRMRLEGDIHLICTSRQDHATRIQALDNLFKLRENLTTGEMSSQFKISPDCEPVIDAVLNYVWDKEDVDNPNIKPKHDWASHYTSSLEFLAINRFPIVAKSKVHVERVR
jgi:hypothetical protein